MLLAIDVGNTNIVLGVFEGERLTQSWRLATLRERYASMGRAFPASNERQADRPEGSEPIHNRLGSAPGFALRVERALLVSLPGVPREMTTMFAEEVVPLLRRLGAGGGGVIATRSLHLFGAPESEVGERIDDLMLMSIRPGWSGQTLNEEIYPRLEAARSEIDRRGLDVDLEIDGGVKVDNARRAVDAGANVLIAASGLFGQADVPGTAERLAEIAREGRRAA